MIRRRAARCLLLCLGSRLAAREARAQTISEVVIAARDDEDGGAESESPLPLRPGDLFSVSWTLTPADGEPLTTGDLKVYEITLEECADGAGTCSCEAGDSLAGGLSLCDDSPDQRCVDSDGSYDLELPVDTAAPGVYLVRVGLADDPGGEAFGCTYGFSVEEAEEDEEPDISVVETAPPGSSIEVESGAAAFPGEAFTARWVYDDGSEEGEDGGAGGSAGDFAVDLYSCEGGACNDGRYFKDRGRLLY